MELAEAREIDIAVCDVQLPGIDGLEVVRALKRRGEVPAFPVIAVTALAMVGDRDRILAAGFDGYLSKPLDPQTFVSKIEAHLPAELRSGKSPAPPPTPDSARPVRPPQKDRTILVVDDEPDNIEVLRSTLEPSGYTVVTARSGGAAMRRLKDFRPDLILADLHLKGEPDFELIERVRQQPDLAEIPFVFLSSTSRQQSLAETARAADRRSPRRARRRREPSRGGEHLLGGAATEERRGEGADLTIGASSIVVESGGAEELLQELEPPTRPWGRRGRERSPPMAGERILVVDDSALNLKLARTLLELEGYEVRTAEDAEQAMQILATFRPLLILMDLQLPGMDGLELTRRLKADFCLGSILVLAVTAYAMKTDRKQAIAAGCDAYLAKPIDTETLPVVVRELLEGRDR